jgi:serine/threonine-protein kinase TTK/MPS1
MKERGTTFGTAGSTTRRLGGLSRFGGPARRITPAEAEALAAQEEQNSPVLMRKSLPDQS